MEKLKSFGQTTSVKGIPRAIKSKSKFVRALWTICVIAFLITAGYQTYILTKQFFSFAVATTLLEYPVDRFDQTDKSVDTPALTFCNKNPFASNPPNASDVPSVQQFYDRVINITECPYCSPEVQEFFLVGRSLMLKPAHYYGFIGMDNATLISHSLESMLVSCQIMLLEGTDTRLVDCKDTVNIQLFSDVDHYNCYTMRLPPPSFPGFLHVGVTLVFHLDNFFTDHLTYFDQTRIDLRMSGIDLYIHDPTLPPSLGIGVTTLPPGLATNLDFRFQRYSRLSEPYGQCMEETVKDNRTYSRSLCYGVCAQQYIADKCGCLDYNTYSNMLLTDDYLQLPRCNELVSNLTLIFYRWGCVTDARNEAVLACGEGCLTPCDEVTYETKVMQ